MLRAPIAQGPHRFAGDVGRLFQGQALGSMKGNQGVAFAHGERPSGAGVFVIRNPAGDQTPYSFGHRWNARMLPPAPVFELFGECVVKHDSE
jgi:hypothetical protein